MKTKLLLLLCAFTGLAASGQSYELDPGFGTDGIALPEIGPGTDVIRNIELQTDGKILVSGYSWPAGGTNSTGSSTIARFMPDGSLDASFGTNGIISEQLSTWSRINQIKVLADGNILALGIVELSVGNAIDVMIKYTAAGVRDTSFGVDGYLQLGNPSSEEKKIRVSYLGITDNGKIIGLGTAAINKGEYGWHTDFIALRFNSDGTIDTDFGVNGETILSFDYLLGDPYLDVYDAPRGILIQPDGKIVTAVRVPGECVFFRLNPDGSLDEDFGEEGFRFVPSTIFYANAPLLLQPDGKIVLSGVVYPPDYNPANPGSVYHEHAMIRLTADGNTDTDFGFSGKVTSVFPGFAFRGGSAVLMPDGKIMVAGVPFAPFATTQPIVFIRYNSNGTYDSIFGTDGQVLYNFGENEGYNVYDMLLQSDSKLLLGGGTGINPDLGVQQEFYLMRFRETETTGLTDNTLSQISLYPNPISSMLTLANADNLNIENIIVTDMTGKTVLSQKGNNPEINVEVLPQGVYFVNISGQEGEQHLKFVKE